jgi:membrane protein implicated in regulation of membrane protease activity
MRRYRRTEYLMIILGLILLIIGFIAKIAILWTIGIIVLVVGLILALLGTIGRGVGGRRHYW